MMGAQDVEGSRGVGGDGAQECVVMGAQGCGSDGVQEVGGSGTGGVQVMGHKDLCKEVNSSLYWGELLQETKTAACIER